MKTKLFAALLALLALTASCGSDRGAVEQGRVSLEAVYGSTLEGVELDAAGDRLTLIFASLPEQGKMLRLNLPADTSVGEERWQADAQTVHLVAPVSEGAEIGIVPSAGYSGTPVRLELTLETGRRQVSIPPVGEANLIRDFTVTGAGLGLVDLAWTQINAGDYNFDGEVNISDLTPMAPRIGLAVDRAQAGAELLTAYWIDGDSNGEINIADITPIGANYRAQVVGYNIRQNGAVVPGSSGGPSVTTAQAQFRAGLPNRYLVQLAGQASDAWSVSPVDKDGVEGADSTGNLGPVDLRANLNIIGLELLDLQTGQPGEFGPGKFSTRVIDPGDIVARAPIGSASLAGTSSTIRSLPRNRAYMIDFRYAPKISLATGLPKGGSSVKGASAVSEDDIVTTSFIFHLDEGQTPGDIDVTIEAKPNPEGGYLLDLHAVMSLPGNNPVTAVAESGYIDDQKTRQYYAQAEISRDTNNNGSFDDNSKICDPDLDAVGDGLRELLSLISDEDDQFDEGEEIEVEGTLAAIDFCDTTVSLQPGFVVESGTFDPTPGLLWYFSEATEFIERTDQFEDGIVVEPSGFAPGEQISVDLYPIEDAAGNFIGYWVERVKRDLRT